MRTNYTIIGLKSEIFLENLSTPMKSIIVDFRKKKKLEIIKSKVVDLKNIFKIFFFLHNDLISGFLKRFVKGLKYFLRVSGKNLRIFHKIFSNCFFL